MAMKDDKSVDLTALHGDALLSDVEVAATFRLNAGELRNWRCVGRGPRHLKIGRSVRYRLRDVVRWLEESTVTLIGNAQP